jgi:DNA mismatch repair ATPase MutS
MQRFENCVLLTRVGGFYELYFEQAEEYGPMLNLKVARKKTNAGPVPMVGVLNRGAEGGGWRRVWRRRPRMAQLADSFSSIPWNLQAGFPFFQLDRFLKILVQDLNRYVAIAEEFPNSASDRVKSGGLMHDRRVARIVTPGTLIDENFMDPYANNYVMAIHLAHEEEGESDRRSQPLTVSETSKMAASRDISDISKFQSAESTPLGLAWLDLSTGHFFTQAADLASLSTILSRVSPREVILDREMESSQNHSLFSILAEDRQLMTYAPPGPKLELSDWSPMLESQIPPSLAGAFTRGEIVAGGLLLLYVRDRLQGLSMKLQPPLRYANMEVMNIDKNSLRALEIKQTIRDGFFRGSLLHAVRRTATRSGARLLNEWLSEFRTPSAGPRSNLTCPGLD